MRRVFPFASVTVLVASGLAFGQAFRGGVGASRGSMSWGQTGASSATVGQTPSSVRQGPFVQSSDGGRTVQVHGRGAPISIQQRHSTLNDVARGVGPGGSFATAPVARQPVVAPHRRFRPPFVHPFFPRHRGILIIEVPRFVGTSIITQGVSGGGWTEQRFARGSSVDTGLRVPGQLAPFDPTPQEIVERMLALAGVREGDVVYDLGSGDGRVVIAAAKKYRAKAVGFEIDPGLVKLARENVRREGVEKLVEIRQQDFMTADLSPATVITLYLSSDGNLAVRPALMSQLKPGARVVSYTFDMGDWPPKVMETYRDAAGDTHLLYLWQVHEPQLYSENSTQLPQ